ncbi:MAG: Spy/CpxP family protein refolding chaperone [Pseudorhodoplanes sp.]|nr:Spy/CpxP family protein refolding chaperone [Pseudorhodoplanes sp.]
MRAYCHPQAAGFGTWRLGQIEQIVKPDQNQRNAFDDFRAASDKAAQMLSAACPVEVPQTVSARLALMEARMTLMLDAVKTIRPAFDTFYATLTAEQKARLDASRPRRWFWDRWRS